MNKELKAGLKDSVYIAREQDDFDSVISYVDEHFVAKEEVTAIAERAIDKALIAEMINNHFFNKEQVLEIIGKKINVVKEWEIWEEKGQDYINGYNQAKAEIRERLNK